MPSQNHRPRPKYPLTVLDLSDNQLELLIKVLTTENPLNVSICNKRRNERVTSYRTQQAIKSLPGSLRKRPRLLLLPSALLGAPTLCNTHKSLNPDIIDHILRLIKREVEEHLDHIISYSPEPLLPDLKGVILCLQSIEGMWWVPSPSKHRNVPTNGVQYQHNKCEACMITRVIQSPLYLQNFHAALKSRTRTSCRHRAPKLERVIRLALANCADGERISYAGTKLAIDLKKARKAAFRNMRSHSQNCDRKCMDNTDNPGCQHRSERQGDNDNGDDNGNDSDHGHVNSRSNRLSSSSTETIQLILDLGEDRPASYPPASRSHTQSQIVDEIISYYTTTEEEWAAAMVTHQNQNNSPPHTAPLPQTQSMYHTESEASYEYGRGNDTSSPPSAPAQGTATYWGEIPRQRRHFSEVYRQIQEMIPGSDTSYRPSNTSFDMMCDDITDGPTDSDHGYTPTKNRLAERSSLPSLSNLSNSGRAIRDGETPEGNRLITYSNGENQTMPISEWDYNRGSITTTNSVVSSKDDGSRWRLARPGSQDTTWGLVVGGEYNERLGLYHEQSEDPKAMNDGTMF